MSTLTTIRAIFRVGVWENSSPQDMPEWQQQICHSIQYTDACCYGSYFKSGPWNDILDMQQTDTDVHNNQQWEK